MPTVIALDVSLSMSRPVLIPDCSEEYERRHLAVNGINSLLDFMTQNCKLEFFSLVVFSYLWDQLVTFTRDFDAIKAALNKIEIFNKTCIESVLTGIKALIADEWSTITPSQIILITDGNAGTGPGSLKRSLERAAKSPDEKFPLPFAFPCILNIVCLASPTDPDLQSSLPLYQKLVELSSFGGEVFVPETVLNMKSVQEMFLRLANRYYTPFYGNLHCGNMNCAVQLYPSPNSCLQNPTGSKPLLSNTLKICGFLDIADVSSPPTISRHLVLPVGTKDKENDNEQKPSKSDDADGLLDDGRIPAFTVLLHGSLKVESMVALTQVGEDWFGLMYSWADSKKKSNLILALFEQGLDTLTWLGNFDHLASMSEFSESPYGEDDSKTPFPVRPAEKHSYAQSCVVWIKPSGLQADLQKVLRHARKLPDKQQQFYKELNRIRRAALAFGFYELLEAMAAMLERECTMLPGTAHPSAAMQLTHAANALRSDSAKDVIVTVMPLQTNFSAEDG